MAAATEVVVHQENALARALCRSRALRVVPLLFAGLLLFSRLSCPLLEPEETRYAEIPRQMLAEHRFVTPVWHGEPYWQKPPLLYWLVMGSYELFGVHDWAARLVPCLAAFATVLIVYGWTWRTAGPAAGFCSALILALAPRFIYQGRMIGMDGLLALWVTAGLAAGQLAITSERLRRKWWTLSALACGLGLLTKGPIALVLVGGPLFFWSRFSRSAIRPRLWQWLGYLGMVTGVAAPWYAALAFADPEAAGAFFWLHNVQRFVMPFDHAEPLWYFVPILLVGTLPWSLLVVPLIHQAVRRAGAAHKFSLLSFGWCLVFFSLAGCKRTGYSQPMLPLWSAVLGTFLARRLANRDDAIGGRAWLRAWASPLVLTGVALVAGAGMAVTAGVAGLCSLTGAIAVAAVLVSGAFALFAARHRVSVSRRWAACAGTVFVLMLVAVVELLPAYHRRFSLRGQVRRHVDEAAGIPVACYPRRWDSVSFYLDRLDVQVYAAAEQEDMLADLARHERVLVFVKNRGYRDRFLAELPTALEFVPDGRQGSNVTSGFVCRKGAQSPRRAPEVLALRVP